MGLNANIRVNIIKGVRFVRLWRWFEGAAMMILEVIPSKWLGRSGWVLWVGLGWAGLRNSGIFASSLNTN